MTIWSTTVLRPSEDSKIHYQYANGASSETEGTSKTNRYMALGFTYTQPKYFVALAGDWLNVQSAALKEGNWKLKDAYKVLLGGHYKFDSFKLFRYRSIYEKYCLHRRLLN